jgi:hypothetical protein
LYQRPGRGIPLNVSGPAQPAGVMAKRGLAQLLGLAMTVLAVAEYRTGRGAVTVAWLAIGPLLASLVLRPRTTAMVAGWAMLPGVVGDDDGMHPVAGASFGQDPADVGLDGGFGRE